MKIEYFSDGAIDCPLILIYGDDPTGAKNLRNAVEDLANGLIARLAIHDFPGYLSVGDCKLFAKVGRDDIGISRIGKEPTFECTLQKDTWLEVVDLLEPFLKPFTDIQNLGSTSAFQYLTNCYGINMLISTERAW
jgi:hypothetical protein